MKLPELNDTICALATPLGHSALAVIRLSGPQSFAITDAICNRPVSHTKGNRQFFRKLLDRDGTILDQAVILTFHAPHSFTGQDAVEFSLHGSPLLIEKTINRLLECGARSAAPGEFSLRAFWNGKISLDQAEGIAALISAQDDVSRVSALRLLEGEVGQHTQSVYNDLTALIAKLELELDFSEEDVPLYPTIVIISQIEAIIQFINKLTATSQRTKNAADGIRIAIAGPPNVGKSSLLNRLLARDRAIVSHIPGTTRDVVEGEIHLAGRQVKLYDTAGIRHTEDEVEREGVKRSRHVHKNADLVLWLQQADRVGDLENLETETAKTRWIILNKIDLIDSEQRKQLRKQLKKVVYPKIYLSAKTGIGISVLLQQLELWITQNYSSSSDSIVPLNSRHEKLYFSAKKSLQSAKSNSSKNAAIEIVVEDLRAGLSYLSEITGENVNESVLSKIFSGFCIGK